MFREHDQGRPALVEARVHPGGDFDSAAEGETDVDSVAHGLAARVRLISSISFSLGGISAKASARAERAGVRDARAI